MTRRQDGSMSVDPVADAAIDRSQIHASEPFRELVLQVAGLALTVGVLIETGFSLSALFTTAAANSPAGDGYLAPGGSARSFLDTVSVALAFAIGTAALPHILIRFFTVSDAKQARSSAGWATGLIGVSSERGSTRSFDEPQVRSQTGLDSEQATASVH